jgi:hypothetical protein
MRKLEGYKCSLSVRSEGAKEKTQDEDDWYSLLQIFWKMAPDLSLLFQPHIFLNFSIFFWVIENLMGMQTRALQNFFVFQRQKMHMPI